MLRNRPTNCLLLQHYLSSLSLQCNTDERKDLSSTATSVLARMFLSTFFNQGYRLQLTEKKRGTLTSRKFGFRFAGIQTRAVAFLGIVEMSQNRRSRVEFTIASDKRKKKKFVARSIVRAQKDDIAETQWTHVNGTHSRTDDKRIHYNDNIDSNYSIENRQGHSLQIYFFLFCFPLLFLSSTCNIHITTIHAAANYET